MGGAVFSASLFFCGGFFSGWGFFGGFFRARVRVCVRAGVCVRVCAWAGAWACVRACVRACAFIWLMGSPCLPLARSLQSIGKYHGLASRIYTGFKQQENGTHPRHNVGAVYVPARMPVKPKWLLRGRGILYADALGQGNGKGAWHRLERLS